jgi:hypothetical protein
MRGDQGVDSNARLTATAAAVLLVLLAAEGFTILRIHQLRTIHVFLGMLLVPVVLLKVGSTLWRFARYYSGDPSYLRKGPPHWVLRFLGPVVVVLTVVLFASGVVLIFLSGSLARQLLAIHKVSFVLWFGAMTIHVLGHLADTARLAPLDWMRRTRKQVAGAGARTWAISVSLVAGVVLGVVTWGHGVPLSH